MEFIDFFPRLKPFEDVDEIINHYVSRELRLNLSSDKRKSIIENTDKSYSLLAFALQGCVEAKGAGDPNEWLEKGVNYQLEKLEYVLEGPDGTDQTFPEVVVSLSPLYINEVLTAEKYLYQLGFKPNTLNALVELGEITIQKTPDGDVFYGLPHLGQARAYWRYGTTYRNRRNLPDYEDFLYTYAISNAPNGLEAVVEADKETRNKLLKLLNRDNKIEEVLERQKSLMAIASWIEYAEQKNLKRKDTLQLLTKKIEQTNRLLDAVSCIANVCKRDSETKDRFLTQLKWSIIAERVAKISRPYDVLGFIMDLRAADKDAASILIQSLDTKPLAYRLNHVEPPEDPTCAIFHVIYMVSPKEGDKLWIHLNREHIANRLINAETIRILGLSIMIVFQADEDKGWELWRLLGTKRIADKLNQAENENDVYYCIKNIYKGNQKASLELLGLIDEKLRQYIEYKLRMD